MRNIFSLHFNFGYAQMCFTIFSRERNISNQTEINNLIWQRSVCFSQSQAK